MSHNSGDLGRFVRAREDRTLEFEGVDELKRPAAAGDVEERRAGCVGNIGGIFARQAEADVIFGQQDLSNTREIVRFIVTNPE